MSLAGTSKRKELIQAVKLGEQLIESERLRKIAVEAVHLCEQLQPDVVLMDLMMVGMNGAEATRAIRKKYLEIQVLILTSFLANDLVQQAMQAGAIGYLLKGISIDELADTYEPLRSVV
ncbi:response regulator transcription factor [Nostocales cyanobacterium LEGE 12452]|nr:response regulator transcription factor [Nostocales cyanobacterium LEGE 12452]